MQGSDASVELGKTPGFVVFVGPESFGFLGQEVKVGEVSTVISIGDVVTFSSLIFNWSWPPYISINFTTKFS